MQRTKFLDRMASARLSRREMLAGAAAFGVGLSLQLRAAQAADVLTCMEWSGYDVPDYFKSFVTRHKATPNFSIIADEEEALAKVRAGFSADVMHPCNYSVQRFVNAGLTREIDTARLSNWKDVFPALQSADGVVVDGRVVMAPADWGNSSIAYRPDLVGEEFAANPSWSIFYDDRYAGKVSMFDGDVALTIGAMVGGMPYSEAYMLSGPALSKVAAEWGAKALRTSRFLWTDPSEVQQALASGEIVAGYAYNDVIKNLAKEGIPVAYATPKEGFFTWFCGLTLLNSGKADPVLAHDFIDAWLSPETGKLLIEESGYGHANMKSFAMADPAEVAAMGFTDPAAHMKDATLFRPVPDEVQAELNKTWSDLKALKQ